MLIEKKILKFWKLNIDLFIRIIYNCNQYQQNCHSKLIQSDTEPK